MRTTIKKHFSDLKSEIGPRQQKETGLVIILLCLIMAYIYTPDVWLRIALPATLITLVWPRFFYPFALLWFSLAKILSKISSTVILTLLFVLLLLPVGLLRKWMKKDSLRLRAFKQNDQSVFTQRMHLFDASDFKHPF